MDNSRRWDPRRRHPDDYLRDLARSGRAPTSPILRSGHRRKRDMQVRRTALATAVLTVVLVVALVPLLLGTPNITVEGIADGAVLNASGVARLRAEVQIDPKKALAKADITVNGKAVSAKEIDGKRVFAPGTLDPGEYVLTVRSGDWKLWRPPERKVIHFVVDTGLPTLAVNWPTPDATALDKPYVVTGRTETGVKLLVAGRPVDVDPRGDFVAEFSSPPVGNIIVEASDAAGNSSERHQRSGLALPFVRGVYLSSAGWTTPKTRNAVFGLVDAGKINTVVIDIKDDTGRIPHTSAVRRALDIGAALRLYDLSAVVAQLHARGVRVVGRLVTFRDPALANAQWLAGQTDWVVQARSGGPAGSDAAQRYTNPYSRGVREYYAALAVEAAKAGVDDILLDGVERPTGDAADQVFPDAAAPIDEELASFVQEIGVALQGTRARLGLTLSHSVAISPERSGQDPARLAPLVDFLSPITFPSSYAPGDFGVEDPLFDSSVVVYRALEKFIVRTRGYGVRLTPWIQDFSKGRRFGPKTLSRQISQVDQIGLSTWILMNPSSVYSVDGIPKIPDPLPGAPPDISSSETTTVPASTADSATAEDDLASPG